MSLPSLGYCTGNSDTLIQSGIATASWVPDGLGGGTLTVAVPASSDCAPGVPSDDSYYVGLSLIRGKCGQRFQITVSGTGNSYFSGSTTVQISDAVTLNSSATETTTCGTAPPLVATSGENPSIVTIGTPCTTFTGPISPWGMDISVYGDNYFSQAHEITVTVTAL